MHEMALCTKVVETVEEVAKQANAIRVNDVSMVVGEMRDIVADLFDEFFHFLARGTIAENATVTFSFIPTTMDCAACGLRFPIALRSLEAIACPNCSSCDCKLATGNEFYIESIDVTTADEIAAK